MNIKNARQNLECFTNEDKKDKEFVYQIGQLVKIKDLNLKGRISGIYIGPQRIVYDVRYFWEGTSKDLFFRHNEIELISESSENLGF